MALTIRTEQDRDKAQVRSLWKTCFSDSEPFMDWFFQNRWLPSYGVVAEENGQIVSAMQGYPYVLSIREKPVRATMLTGVSTRQDYRGRGIMAKGLAKFMSQSEQHEEYVVFHTPANHPTFFKCLHHSATRTAIVRSDGKPCVRMPEALCDIAAEASLAEALLPVYRRAMENYSGVVSRRQTDMALKLADYSSDGGRILLCTQGDGIISGYAAYTPHEDGEPLSAEEVAATDDPTRNSLLSGLLCVGNGRAICAKLPPDRAERLPEGFHAEVIPTGVMGVSNMSALLRTLGGFDDITVEVRDHMAESNAGIFTFSGKRTHGGADISIDAGRLLQLLNGYASIEELIEQDAVNINNPHAVEKLSQRFPKQICYVAEEY